MVKNRTKCCEIVSEPPAQCGRLAQNSNDMFSLCSAHIELSHIIQTQAGQTAVRSVQVPTAAVDVDDPIPMPDGTILVRSAGEKDRRRVADDVDGGRIGTCAVRFHPAPDAGIMIFARETVDKMKFLIAHCEFQRIR